MYICTYIYICIYIYNIYIDVYVCVLDTTFCMAMAKTKSRKPTYNNLAK